MGSDLVLDATAFYAGMPFLSGKRCITTSAIIDEVRHIKKSHSALDMLIDTGNLQIIDPENESIHAVIEAAKKTGDIQKLSKADISVIALALQTKATIVSDDYAVANVTTTLGIMTKSSSGKGIKEVRKWIAYCSACSRAFGPDVKKCPLCDNLLKRKYKVIG